ncbi:hypothetical protein, partial [Pseudomonas aeruginosa]|uniref:hypothetical protein n=1 Tax=Pseudomonas aeruginosa TaxID=287 RepID=UPI0030070925
LIELDRVVEQQIAPLYYGRYVDDILLVMESGASFRSTAEAGSPTGRPFFSGVAAAQACSA